MKNFSDLLNQLFYSSSTLTKIYLLKNYLQNTQDPERGWGIAIICGELKFPYFKSGLIRELMLEKIDPTLFKMSYDYVGDLSETVAHLWPTQKNIENVLPSLSEFIDFFMSANKAVAKEKLSFLLDHASPPERWAILKIATGSLRIGVSNRLVKTALAEFGQVTVQAIEEVWHAMNPPYTDLFAWLAGGIKPNLMDQLYFHPVMLSHPLSEKDLVKISADDYFAEWKYDGIRVQIAATAEKSAIYTRTGDDISHAFPDLLANIAIQFSVLDGELVIFIDNQLATFNDLQQRLNRKNPSKKLILEKPAHFILYDVLIWKNVDLTSLPLIRRRAKMQEIFAELKIERLHLSPLVAFDSTEKLLALKQSVVTAPKGAIEGLMLKRKESTYIPGRPSGQWYKWKRDPFLIDAVLMYAQRGHGKRSSYYSDYTFGVWHGDILLTLGKAYFGFTDKELLQLDKWIRNHTVTRFGPVREVSKELVLEVAFDSAQISNRHKSGYALRFPRINRIRWDKPASEADHLEAIKKLIN